MNKRFKLLIPLTLLIPLVLACSLISQAPAVVQPVITQVIQRVTPQPINLPAAITNEEAILVDLYKRLNPSVVTITTHVNQDQEVDSSSLGSGFVYDTAGNIVTNFHVVHGSDRLEVTFADGTIQAATIVGSDPHSDLSVIKVASLPPDAAPLILGNLEDVAVGQTVVAIGNPFGLGGTLTRGIVSALGRSIPALTSFSIPQSIQTDAPINPGNSGGPLLNLKGEVIGVNDQIETTNGERINSGVGFAIPVNIVRKVVPELIANGKFDWPWLGISGTTVFPALVKAMNLPVDRGAYVMEIFPNTPADDANLVGASKDAVVDGRQIPVGGDVISAINGQPVNTFEDVLLYITENTKPGQQVVLTIIRDGESQDVTLTLQRRPDTLAP
jgi:S1-C subfamily serine protease